MQKTFQIKISFDLTSTNQIPLICFLLRCMKPTPGIEFQWENIFKRYCDTRAVRLMKKATNGHGRPLLDNLGKLIHILNSVFPIPQVASLSKNHFLERKKKHRPSLIVAMIAIKHSWRGVKIVFPSQESLNAILKWNYHLLMRKVRIRIQTGVSNAILRLLLQQQQ